MSHRVSRAIAWVARCTASVAVVSCAGAPEDSLDEQRQGMISDEHHGGVVGFAFLPPMVPSALRFGDVVTSANPTVRVDEIDANGATVQTLVSFTGSALTIETSAKDIDKDDDPTGNFIARWNSAGADLSVGGSYRVRVLVPTAEGGHRELGFADLAVLASRKQVKTVDTQSFTPLVKGDELRIRFRIDRPAVDPDVDGVLDWVDNCPDVANADQVDTLGDGIGDACRCDAVTCPEPASCHSAGTCDPATGACTAPVAADGTTCSAPGASSASCQAGSCIPLTCTAGFGNCDGQPANGCETSVATDPLNCGACGTACDMGVSCEAGACDLCPSDPSKTHPGICGCGVTDVDSDGDAAADCIDGCPFDPNKLAPGICGCSVADTDSDGDFTPDCFDNCLGDPKKTLPGVCGCGVPDTDTDEDGTANCLDGCPLDSLKLSPGVCGCGISDNDSDGDASADCIDGCPLDPFKVDPLICGCGLPDIDTDDDGFLDCDDACPQDPSKTYPGECGCGVPDDDTDGDAVPDCMDGCPLDPDKIEPLYCGCGTPELPDADGDGVPDCS